MVKLVQLSMSSMPDELFNFVIDSVIVLGCVFHDCFLIGQFLQVPGWRTEGQKKRALNKNSMRTINKTVCR